jgi:hypothetical protein
VPESNQLGMAATHMQLDVLINLLKKRDRLLLLEFVSE